MGDMENRRHFRKIVVTGGPCAGKTTGLTWIQNTFEKMGYTILFLQEPATEMMTAGVTPSRCSSPLAYQEFQMKLQYEKEKAVLSYRYIQLRGQFEIRSFQEIASILGYSESRVKTLHALGLQNLSPIIKVSTRQY